MPYEEIPHTADWCLRVWGADLPALFVEAARGMNSLAGMQPAPGPVRRKTFESTASDPESLLVSFLSELVYAAEQENTVFDRFEVHIAGQGLRCKMKGAPLLTVKKNIKAVTFHNLNIRQTNRGFEVEIVFDV
jgi:SHS2 domain-containing protein